MAIGAILGGLLGAGGSIGGSLLSKPKVDRDIFGGFDPFMGVLANLFGIPGVLGRGGFQIPSEQVALRDALQRAQLAYGPQAAALLASGAGGGLTPSINTGIRGTQPFSIGNFGMGGGGGGLTLPGGVVQSPTFSEWTSSFPQLSNASPDQLSQMFGGSDFPTVAPGFGFGFAPPVVSPLDLFALRDVIQPVPSFGLESSMLGLVDRAAKALPGITDFFQGPLAQSANELAQTGFKTDIGPMREAALGRLNRETIPAIAEKFSGLTGGFSSDFMRAITDAGRQLEERFGELGVEASERANARRAAGLPTAALIGQAGASFPLLAAQDIFGATNTLQDFLRAQSPGGQILEGLRWLKSLAAPASNIRATEPGGGALSAFGQSLSRASQPLLSDSLQGLGQSIGTLFNRGSTGTADFGADLQSQLDALTSPNRSLTGSSFNF